MQHKSWSLFPVWLYKLLTLYFTYHNIVAALHCLSTSFQSSSCRSRSFADIICSCLWILLAIAGLAVQLTLYFIQKQRYKKKQLRSLRRPYVIGNHFRRYTGFPIHSLYCQLKNRWKSQRYYDPVSPIHHWANDTSRPLLSPNSTLNAHAHSSTYGSTYHAGKTWPKKMIYFSLLCCSFSVIFKILCSMLYCILVLLCALYITVISS